METTEENHRRRRMTAVLWLLLVAGLALSFSRNFAEMWVRWFPAWRHSHWSLYKRIMEGESYYTHAPLVPLVSLIIAVLLIRHTRIPVRPARRWGAVVLGVFLVGHLLACLARVNFVSGFALIGVLAGLVLLLWGGRALRRLWFPIALLAFMVPLPEVSIAQLNFRLKMFAADWGVRLADFLGVLVERKGNMVFLEGGKRLVIANVCNGLRTLISLLAFGALYAYVCRLRGWWRIFLFLFSVPVAVVANSVRIVTLIAVADIWNEKIATGWYHDFSGILIFVLAFLLMFGLEKLILGAHKLVGRPVKILPLFHGQLRTERDAGQWPEMIRAGGAKRGVAAVALVGLSAAGAWWLNRTIPTMFSKEQLAAAVKQKIEVDGEPWRFDPAENRELDEQTRIVLENPSYLIRMYRSVRDPDNEWVELCVIFSKDNRKGVHPPDLCLEGGGQDIVRKGEVVLPDVKGIGQVRCRSLVVHRAGKVDKPGGRPSGTLKQYYLYTYKCGSRYTTSFWVQQATIFLNGLLNRDASGALIRAWTLIEPSRRDRTAGIVAEETEEQAIAAAERRAVGILRETLPQLHKTLP